MKTQDKLIEMMARAACEATGGTWVLCKSHDVWKEVARAVLLTFMANGLKVMAKNATKKIGDDAEYLEVWKASPAWPGGKV
mgnify:CR=1 FL=1